MSADEVLSGLALGDRAPAGRPYVVLNMIASADGKAALEGGTRALSGEADRWLFRELRTQVDAVMVGAGTLRAEPYGRLVPDPALRDKRRREGLAADALACLVSGTLGLPADLPLLRDPHSDVVIVTASEPLDEVLTRLRADYGVRSVLCEGGPTLNSSLLELRLVDELFLSVAPTLIGGADALTIVAGTALPDPAALELVWVLESQGYLFLRYRVT